MTNFKRMERNAIKTRIIMIILVIGYVFTFHATEAQNSLVLNGAYLKMNGGTSSQPVYLVVNQSSTTGIKRNSGHIISENQYNYVKWAMGTGTGNFIVPFGYQTTDYLPLTFNKTTSGSASGSFSTWSTDNKNMPHAGSSNGVAAVSKMVGPAGDSISSVVDRWWDIQTSSATTANVTFSYRGAENATTSNPSANLYVQRWNGTKWDAPLATSSPGITSGVGSIAVTGVTSFAPMILVNQTGLLPVSITHFKATCANGGTVINWATASEKNSHYFDLEKSEDGLVFETITTIKAAGFSEAEKHYKFEQKNTTSVYYRLKQVDLDGAYEYSNVIRAACEVSDQGVISLFPNPAINFINHQIMLPDSEVIDIEIIDLTGRTMITQQYLGDKGLNILTTDVHGLGQGFYFAKITYQGKITKLKFIKKDL
jgi:hypothetical protein